MPPVVGNRRGRRAVENRCPVFSRGFLTGRHAVGNGRPQPRLLATDAVGPCAVGAGRARGSMWTRVRAPRAREASTHVKRYNLPYVRARAVAGGLHRGAAGHTGMARWVSLTVAVRAPASQPAIPVWPGAARGPPPIPVWPGGVTGSGSAGVNVSAAHMQGAAHTGMAGDAAAAANAPQPGKRK
jgi:hypothetical protein